MTPRIAATVDRGLHRRSYPAESSALTSDAKAKKEAPARGMLESKSQVVPGGHLRVLGNDTDVSGIDSLLPGLPPNLQSGE
jgi:hypothetical protein